MTAPARAWIGTAIAVLLVVGCSATVASPNPSGASATQRSASPAAIPASPTTGTVTIPEEDLPAHIRCAIEHGMRLETMVPSRLPGGAPGFGMTSDLPNDQALAVMEACAKLSPWRGTKTDAGIRAVYDRWVYEWRCLVSLGFQPTEPPTFEKFLVDWRGQGPWMPFDGLDAEVVRSAAFDQAKTSCTLEMLP